ncbi:MAG: hypothetical protein GWP08_10065 [Nitrospiraceae bacterium]|nr:hypothetical protein [Nitrospiraceae bacterium]
MDYENTGSVEDRLDALLAALKVHSLDDAGEHIGQLERAIAELRAETAQLRLREARLLSANRNLSERLVALRGDDKATESGDTDDDATTIETLKHDVSQREETATGLWRQLNQARRAREAARGAVELLSEEATQLRDDNKQLQSTVESEHGKASSRSRQQRIALETLFREQDAGSQALRLGEIMVAAGAITAEQLGEALDIQTNSRGRLLGEILVERGAASEGDITQVVACQLHVPWVRLERDLIQETPVPPIDKNSCLKHACFPIRATDDCLFLAMADPRDRNALATMEQIAGRRVVPMIATQADISSAIHVAFGESEGL